MRGLHNGKRDKASRGAIVGAANGEVPSCTVLLCLSSTAATAVVLSHENGYESEMVLIKLFSSTFTYIFSWTTWLALYDYIGAFYEENGGCDVCHSARVEKDTR